MVWDASREDSVNSSYFYSRPSVDEVPGAGSGTLTDSPKEEEEEEDDSKDKSGISGDAMIIDFENGVSYDIMAEMFSRLLKEMDL